MREIAVEDVFRLQQRVKEKRCCRCGAVWTSDEDEPGCTDHDWPWEHGFCDPPEGWE
jgi:hypothetical protein